MLDFSRDETSSLRRSLAILHQQHEEDSANNGPGSGKEGTKVEITNVMAELNTWRSVYERFEVLHRGEGFQGTALWILV